ncbi:MAG TPA: pilus (MSHA type) biogenesis protein MshL [Steroidobacteraceae bacterium]|nr:pilus (MSHA type) biogenesis protein MshL [Steroidobacteraceae bacterium]
MRRRLTALTLASLLACAVSGAAPAQPAGDPAAAAERVSAEGRFDVSVDNAPAQPFFQGLVEGTRYNMLVHPEVGGHITLTLRHVTIEEVLEATRDLYGYDYRRTRSGFLVLPAVLQSRVFHLNYLDLKRFGVSNTRISSGQVTQSGNNSTYGNTTSSGPGVPQTATDPAGRPLDVTGTSVVTRADSDFWSGIEADLHALVGTRPGRSVVINRQSGLIVVHAMPNELHDVSEYLEQTAHTVARQVVLEAKIVEVDLNDGYQAGINWASLLQHGSSTYLIGQQAPSAVGVNPLTTPPATNPYLPPYPSGGVNVQPGIGNPLTGFVANPISSAFTIAANFADFNAFIQLLSVQGHTRVLSSPRVSTLHNQQAIIKAGTDEFFVTGVQSNTVTGTATSTSQNVQLTPFFSGVALDVTPQIDGDDSVILHIHPTISEVTDETKTLTVQGSVDTIPLALSQIRESDSIVRAKSGQLVIIGGLMREELTKANYKTPILGDLPGLGKLFRSEQHQRSTIELVILLRAIVVAEGDWAGLVSEPAGRLRELNQSGDFGPLDYPAAGAAGPHP